MCVLVADMYRRTSWAGEKCVPLGGVWWRVPARDVSRRAVCADEWRVFVGGVCRQGHVPASGVCRRVTCAVGQRVPASDVSRRAACGGGWRLPVGGVCQRPAGASWRCSFSVGEPESRRCSPPVCPIAATCGRRRRALLRPASEDGGAWDRQPGPQS